MSLVPPERSRRRTFLAKSQGLAWFMLYNILFFLRFTHSTPENEAPMAIIIVIRASSA